MQNGLFSKWLAKSNDLYTNQHVRFFHFLVIFLETEKHEYKDKDMDKKYRMTEAIRSKEKSSINNLSL